MNAHTDPRPGRRSAKNRPLSGVLIRDGRQEVVVVTAHEKRLVINVEADISAIPIARVRRDDGLNLVRTDQRDWMIRFDTLPPTDSWVHDLDLLPPPSPARRLALILLGLLGVVASLFWMGRDRVTAMASPHLSPVVADGVCRTYFSGLGTQCRGGRVQVAFPVGFRLR